MVKKHSQPENPEVWIQRVAESRPETDITLLKYAIHLHEGKDPHFLKTGLIIADTLLEMDLDSKTLAAAIIYPAFKMHEIQHEGVAEHFGEEIKSLLVDTMQMQSLEKLQEISSRSHYQIENLRKLLLAMVSDIRAVLIILAEKLVDLRQAKELPPTEQRALAQKTMSIFAPLANRLGVWQLKWEIEDLCFRYLQPETYKRIASLLTTKRAEREKYIIDAMNALTNILNENHVKHFNVMGRVKHIYSIYSKMQRKGSDFNEIFDITAMRVLVDTVDECYHVLSILQSVWRQIPEEFDDYISQPKPNGYRSLHTLIIGPEQQVIEVQIRTFQMHQESELGVASHWRYKEGILETSHYEAKIALLRQLMAWQNEMANVGSATSKEPMKDLFADRIYVFTPMGDIIDLPQGATPLDFAYHIHSEVGHRCRGAKADGKMLTLTTPLKTGQRVEILTSKQHNPSRDWLNPHLGYIKTAKARSHLQHWFRLKDAVEKAPEEKEAHVKPMQKPKYKEKVHGLSSDLQTLSKKSVLNVSNFLTKVARCCRPLPGDPVIGYITQKNGLSIHRKTCSNISYLKGQNLERFIEIDLGERFKGAYPVDIDVHAYRHASTLRDITAALADIHIQVAGFRTNPASTEAELSIILTIVIPNIAELDKAIQTLKHLPNVIGVHRM